MPFLRTQEPRLGNSRGGVATTCVRTFWIPACAEMTEKAPVQKIMPISGPNGHYFRQSVGSLPGIRTSRIVKKAFTPICAHSGIATCSLSLILLLTWASGLACWRFLVGHAEQTGPALPERELTLLSLRRKAESRLLKSPRPP